MVRLNSLLCVACLLFTMAVTAAEQEDPVAQLAQQIRGYYLQKPPVDADKVLTYATTLRDDGDWADVNYASQQRSAWPTVAHLDKVHTMVVALLRGDVPVDQRALVMTAIRQALAHWRTHDYSCPNWWHNEINVPSKLAIIAILLGDQLPPDDFTYITQTVLPRSPIGRTGQNLVWQSGNALMFGVLKHDQALIEKAATAIFGELKVTTSEGIQPDASFHQHGPQQQFGNYGAGFVDDQLLWAMLLRGTPWAMPQEKFDILRWYILEGYTWTAWRGVLDISACGRQLAPNSPQTKGQAFLAKVEQLAQIDQKSAATCAAILKRNAPGVPNDLIGTRYFWRSEYLINRRPDFCTTLKMCSKRVTGAESLNSENFSGYYLADGAFYIYRQGDEYQNIFPVWNWRQLPGVTCVQNGPLPKFGYQKGNTTFVGGVSDGQQACAVLDYQRDGITAHKAWFMAGDLIACLGSGITAAETVTEPVGTTVNQCRLRGEVRVKSPNGEVTLEQGTRQYAALEWVEHDGIRYTFPQPQTVTLSNQPQTGSWRKIYVKEQMPEDVTADVFTLAIEHGTRPDHGSYAYFIQPTAQTRAAHCTILANTETVQAVRFDYTQVQAAFYVPGSIELAPGKTLTVNAPCVLLLDISNNKLSIADPTQTLTEISGQLNGLPWNVILPTGAQAGSTVSVTIK